MISTPVVIEDSNLSYAWGRAFLLAREPPSANRLGPLIVSVTEFRDGEAVEDPRIRGAVDEALASENLRRQRNGDSHKLVYTVEECAFTIFPFWRWYRNHRPSAGEFFAKYIRVLPRLRKRDRRNSRGTYFERMIAFRGRDDQPLNQLGEILRWWQRDQERNRSTRHSALQVACFDPTKDHTGSALAGFPCLQQVSFAYDGRDGRLAVSGYYPTQYLFERGYGNYLGLCRLGHFMAGEMGLTLCRMNCYVNYPLRNDAAPLRRQALATVVRDVLAENAEVHHE